MLFTQRLPRRRVRPSRHDSPLRTALQRQPAAREKTCQIVRYPLLVARSIRECMDGARRICGAHMRKYFCGQRAIPDRGIFPPPRQSTTVSRVICILQQATGDGMRYTGQRQAIRLNQSRRIVSD